MDSKCFSRSMSRQWNDHNCTDHSWSTTRASGAQKSFNRSSSYNYPRRTSNQLRPSSGNQSRSCNRGNSRSQNPSPPIGMSLGFPHMAQVPARDHVAQMSRQLVMAIEKGDTQQARRCLRQGADVNFSSPGSSPPLHYATAESQWDLVSLLLNRGANVNARNCLGFTPLHMAAYYDRRGHILACLIAAGANLDTRTRTGQTALHVAADCGNLVAVTTLLSAGAKKIVKDQSGLTPFALAKRIPIRKLLRPTQPMRNTCDHMNGG